MAVLRQMSPTTPHPVSLILFFIYDYVSMYVYFFSKIFRLIICLHSSSSLRAKRVANLAIVDLVLLIVKFGQYASILLNHLTQYFIDKLYINPLNPELNPICYLLALLGAHHFLHVSRIRIKLLTFRRLMSYIYIYIYIWSTHSWCF